MIAFISMITLLEIQIKGRKFDGIHLIAFPTIFLFFSTPNDLKIILILQSILLTYGQYVFIKILYSKNTEKWILDLSLIISIIVQFNYVFAVFYLFPLFVFFHRALKEVKQLLALLLPILIIPFTFNSLSIILPCKIFALINPFVHIKLLKIQLLSNADIVWLITLVLSVVICALQLSRGYRKLSYPELFSGLLYRTFWLFFSITFGLLGLQTSSERWFISFIPVAYFLVDLSKTSGRILKKTFYIQPYFWAL